MLTGFIALVLPLRAQNPQADWHAEIRKYADEKDWASAMHIVDQEIARAPEDMDVRAWRARVLEWSGRLAQAETEYLQVLRIANRDPDNWLGLGRVYLRLGNIEEALRAFDMAVELDPSRTDAYMARGQALAAAGQARAARQDFQKALSLNPANAEARAAESSVMGEPKNELRLGQESNAFNFLYPNYDEWASLRTQWTKRWSTTVLGNFFQWGPAHAGKFGASLTGRLANLGALTIGGDAGHDSGVIPKREAFFEIDHGWKTSEAGFVRGLDLAFNQHWYWYKDAKVLTLTGVVLAYLPNDWTFSISATAARNEFAGLTPEWQPSEVVRIGFPLKRKGEKRISGNLFFGAGTEDFASVDQIGSFASQTFGGALRFLLTQHQDISPYASYQKRSQGRTDANFGLNYGFRF